MTLFNMNSRSLSALMLILTIVCLSHVCVAHPMLAGADNRQSQSARQSETNKAPQSVDHYETAKMMVTKTLVLYIGDVSTWPFKVNISHSGSVPVTKCGPTPAGNCKADNTIALSADLLLEATNESPLAVPFIVGHELAHGIILNTGTPPRHTVLHELAADCISGRLMGTAFGTIPVDQLETIKGLAKLTHSLGDPYYFDPDHHGFGSQRFIAFYLGLESGIRAKAGDQTHVNDCVAFFYD
jgi:hypothetical protein